MSRLSTKVSSGAAQVTPAGDRPDAPADEGEEAARRAPLAAPAQLRQVPAHRPARRGTAGPVGLVHRGELLRTRGAAAAPPRPPPAGTRPAAPAPRHRAAAAPPRCAPPTAGSGPPSRVLPLTDTGHGSEGSEPANRSPTPTVMGYTHPMTDVVVPRAEDFDDIAGLLALAFHGGLDPELLEVERGIFEPERGAAGPRRHDRRRARRGVHPGAGGARGQRPGGARDDGLGRPDPPPPGTAHRPDAPPAAGDPRRRPGADRGALGQRGPDLPPVRLRPGRAAAQRQLRHHRAAPARAGVRRGHAAPGPAGRAAGRAGPAVRPGPRRPPRLVEPGRALVAVRGGRREEPAGRGHRAAGAAARGAGGARRVRALPDEGRVGPRRPARRGPGRRGGRGRTPTRTWRCGGCCSRST